MNEQGKTISREILVEELVSVHPDSVRYLLDRGIAALVCGEPVWGTLEEVARERGMTDAEIDEMVADLSAPAPPG